MEEITVVEIIFAVTGKIHDLKKALLELAQVCQNDPGCLQYEILDSMDQSEKILVLMRWKDLASLHGHETSHAINEFVRKHDGILYDKVTQTEWKSNYTF